MSTEYSIKTMNMRVIPTLSVAIEAIFLLTKIPLTKVKVSESQSQAKSTKTTVYLLKISPKLAARVRRMTIILSMLSEAIAFFPNASGPRNLNCPTALKVSIARWPVL